MSAIKELAFAKAIGGGGGGSSTGFDVEVDMGENTTTAGFNATVTTVAGHNAVSYNSNSIINYCKKVKASGIETIASSAFPMCSKLESVDFPDAKYIQSYAFSGRSSLKEINFPSLISVGDGAFSGCTGITDVYLPECTTISSSSAFGNCTGIKRIVLPKVETLGHFGGCSGVEYIYIGPNCTSISSGAFSGVPITCKVECGFAEGAISGFPANGGWNGNPADLNITYNVPAPTE